MTREEVIEGFKDALKSIEVDEDVYINTLWIEMAIRSLEAWDKVKKDIEKSHLGKWYVGRIDGKEEDVIPVKRVYEIIEKHLKEVES